jgi:hypothetical protein
MIFLLMGLVEVACVFRELRGGNLSIPGGLLQFLPEGNHVEPG